MNPTQGFAKKYITGQSRAKRRAFLFHEGLDNQKDGFYIVPTSKMRPTYDYHRFLFTPFPLIQGTNPMKFRTTFIISAILFLVSTVMGQNIPKQTKPTSQ